MKSPIADTLNQDSNIQLDMAWIPCGTFRMGSEDFYPEERPVHDVSVDGFWIDRHEVTNKQFGAFVEATGYKTLAERPLNPGDFPGAPRPPIWCPVPRSFTRRPARSTCAVTSTGGPGCPEPVGVIRWDLGPRSKVLRNTLWFTLRMKTLKLTHTGQEKNCLPKRSGNLPLAVGLKERS